MNGWNGAGGQRQADTVQATTAEAPVRRAARQRRLHTAPEARATGPRARTSRPFPCQRPVARKTRSLFAHRAQRAPPVSVQRNVEIIAEPCRTGTCATCARRRVRLCGAVGVVEVFRQPNPKQKTETDSHVAVAGEIEIELKAVADCARPGAERVKAALGIHRVCQLRCRSGKQQFFRQSADEAADAVERAVPCWRCRTSAADSRTSGERHERPGRRAAGKT